MTSESEGSDGGPIGPELNREGKVATGTKEGTLYHCGTLTYTKFTLAKLFLWLFWGDFCFTLMEGVAPTLVPVKLVDLGASNLQMGLLMGTIPATISTLMNPVISFKSDRFRSRWGRRIPFLLFPLPFIVLGLVTLAYSLHIGSWLHHHFGYLASLPRKQVIIYTLCFCMIAFAALNNFLTSVFWYLFNDVVPEHLLARFMSCFRLIALAGQSFYLFFLFQYASTHFTSILLCAAAIYIFGFGLMCLNVKEGKYPPPSDYVDGGSGTVSAIKTVASECHSAPLYWYQWIGNFLSSIGNATGQIGGGAITAFGLLFYRSLGIEENGDIGFIFGSIGIATAVLIMISGWLADRYHPIRVVMAGVFMSFFIVLPANMIWLFWHPASHRLVFWIVWTMNVGLAAPALALNGVYDPPLLMRLFPRSRYGQFCSVNAFWRLGGSIFGGVIAGAFLDYMVMLVGKQNAYFYIPVWQFLFSIPCLFLFFRLYRSWKQHGGDENYIPPLSEPPTSGITPRL